MSLEKRFSRLNTIDKIKFIIEWINDPKGKDVFKTIQINCFKLRFLLKLFFLILKGNKIQESILDMRNQFMRSDINTIAKNKEGHIFYIEKGEDLEIINTSREEHLKKYFLPKKNDVIVDIGANIGDYTIHASKKVLPEGKIISIEANPTTFERLVKNLKLNDIKNVQALNIAVFNERKKVRLYQAEINAADSIIFKGEKYTEVQADTLDNIIESLGGFSIDWLKIDVEGAELFVLQGAKKLLEENKQIKVILEIHDTRDFEDIEKTLKKYRFRLTYDDIYSGSHIFAEK